MNNMNTQTTRAHERHDQREHHEPQRDDRLESVLTQCFLPESEEDVDRDATDEQSGADGEAALGQCMATVGRR